MGVLSTVTFVRYVNNLDGPKLSEEWKAGQKPKLIIWWDLL